MSDKILNAFVNSLGIDSRWTAKGIDMRAIKACVLNNVRRFEPRMSANALKKFKFATTAIVTREGVLCEDAIVTKISVPQNETITYATENGHKFIL